MYNFKYLKYLTNGLIVMFLAFSVLSCDPLTSCKDECNSSCGGGTLGSIAGFFGGVVDWLAGNCTEVCTMRFELVNTNQTPVTNPCSVSAGLRLDVTTGTGTSKTLFDDQFTVGSDGKTSNMPINCLTPSEVKGLQINNTTRGAVFCYERVAPCAPYQCAYMVQSSILPTLNFDKSTCTAVVRIEMGQVGRCEECPDGC